MPCDINKIDSNSSGLHIAKEECLGILPGVAGADAEWYEAEPDSYADFGGEVTTVARAPINPSRQNKKGTVTDYDASGGFTTDLTQNNLTRQLEGFFFAAAREKVSTQPINGTQIPLTAVDGLNSEYEAASGLGTFLVGNLIKASGFADAANDGLKLVTAVTATAVEVAETLVADAAPVAASKIEVCGFEFPTGDVNITASATSIVLDSTLTDFTTLGLNVGETIFIGGDVALNQFATNAPGYGRIKSIAANALELDDTSFTPTTETAAAQELQIFFGTVIRNEEDPALIVRSSFQMERTLGEDADGTQSEYLIGAIPNELTVNIPTAEKITVDLAYVAMDTETRTGAVGVKAGDRVAASGEDAFNTSTDVYRLKLSVVDPTALNQAALFAFITEGTITIGNGITPTKAIGVTGAFDATAGNFEVGGSANAYFSTVEAIAAIRNNSDVALNLITAQQNAAVVIDMPLISLGGGRVNVEKDAAIMIPLDTMAAECANGYTLMTCFLPYVPSVGMPS